MNKYKNKRSVLLTFLSVLGWWGFLFPGLSLTHDTVTVIDKETQEEIGPADSFQESERLFWDILSADSDSICIKSKLLTELSAFWEAYICHKSQVN